MKRIVWAMALLATCALAACEKAPQAGEGWKRVGSLDGDLIQFVEIDPAASKDMAVYRRAAAALCGKGQCFDIGFFLPGDNIPLNGSRKDFFANGGWGGYYPALIYNGGSKNFTSWKCDKGPTAFAPTSALCAPGQHARHKAILDLSSRAGWIQGCGMPPTEDRALVVRFINAQPPGAIRDSYQEAWDENYPSALDGPDDPAFCEPNKAKIEASAKEARTVLEAALKE